MASRFSPKFRFWRNGLLVGLAQVPVYLIIFLVARQIGFPVSDSTIVSFVLMLLCGSILVPILASRCITTGRGVTAYDSLERKFEDAGGRLIDEAFGHKIYSKIYSEELSPMPHDALDLCRKLLAKKESEENQDLEFHLHIKLAKFLIKEERYKDAFETLMKALSIHSDDIIANFLIGENCERLGLGQQAIEHYAIAAQAAATDQLRIYIESQVTRVQTEGPKKAGPQTGYRYMSH